MNRMPICLLSAALTFAPCAVAGPAKDFTSLDLNVERVHRALQLPGGIAVAVVHEDQVIHTLYVGMADQATATPVSADTVFYIASATKPMFALQTLLAEQRGELDSAMTLRQMFPDLHADGIGADAVRLRDLLVHTSGISNPELGWATAYTGVQDARSRRALAYRSSADPTVHHGQFRYTNIGYNLVGAWLTQQPGPSWQDRLALRIFAPLKMQHTTASVRYAQDAHWPLARPYSWASPDPMRPLYLVKTDNTMHEAGGVLSTAPDLARFLAAQFSASALPRAVIERSHQVQARVDSSWLDFAREGYAWGWYSGRYQGHRLLHHFGGFPGFHAHLSFMPDERVALVVLVNEDVTGPKLANLIADQVYATLLGQADVDTRMAARFAQLQEQAGGFRARLAEQRAAIQIRPWTLTLPRAAYAGRYRHALLGTMEVSIGADGEMQLRWGPLHAHATGAEQADHVRVEFVPGSGQFLVFHREGDHVDALALDGMRFER